MCGDGLLGPSEACDDANTEDQDGCVGDCTGIECFVPDTHATIQSAIDDLDCATIYVEYGEYAENLSIDRDVTIVGVDEATVRGFAEQDVLNIASGTTTLRNITLLGPTGPHQSGRVVVNLGELVMESGEIGLAYLYDPDVCRAAAIYSEGPVTLRDVDVWGVELFATAEGAQCRGAAIYITGAALWLEDTTIWGGAITLDSSGGRADGGAIYAEASDLTIVGGAVFGGWVYADINDANGSTARGESIYAVDSNIASSTIVDADVGAGEGGVLATSSTHGGAIEISVRNTIMWNSQAALGVDCSTPGAVLESDAYSMFSAPGSCPGASGVEGIDPLFDAEASAELTPTPESPAVDAGDPAGCFDADGVLLDVDQLGLPRHVNGVCDVGAIERQD